jgi:hypothetical protein
MAKPSGLTKALAVIAVVIAVATLLAVFAGAPRPRLRPETRARVSLCGPQIHGGGTGSAQG